MKITRRRLTRLIKEAIHGYDGDIMSLLTHGKFYDFSHLLATREREDIPDIKAVAEAMSDGFLLDVSAVEGSGGGTYQFHAVIKGEMSRIGNVSLDEAIALSRPEFNIVVYPMNIQGF